MLMRTIVAFVAIFVLSYSTASAVDSNFDGDAKSDVILVNIESDNSLTWSYQRSISGYSENIPMSILGKKGEDLAPANWTSTTTTEIGIVALDSSNNVTWSVWDSSAQLQQMAFGVKGDILVSGGDYDGNGISGAAKISKTGAAQVYANMFSSGTTHNLTFPKVYAKLGKGLFVNPDGQKDRLAILLSKKAGKKFKNTLLRKELDGTEAKTTLKGLNKKVRDAMPVAGGDGVDNIVVVTKAGKKTAIEVYNLSGVRLNQRIVSNGSTVLVGEFMDDAAGQEVGVFQNGTLLLYNPVTGTSSTIEGLPNVIALDQVNVNVLKKVVSSDDSGGSDDDGDTGGAGLDSVCPKGVKKVYGGFLWKDDADEKIGPPRAGKPVILFQNGKPGTKTIKIYASNGTQVCSAGLKAPGPGHKGVNCNSDHYYIGWPGGCYKEGGKIAKLAQQASGSSRVYVKVGGGKCVGPINPNARNGRLTCY
ncbi:hypothetical protein OAO01_00045 [Oligoflexia bacterium]|nr:hypothetical protein [Oligoflexia bacterium]